MSRIQHFGRQEGQTLFLVAASMVGFIAICALAVDLTSLYSARSEIQRAADASALAGAKAFVESGITTDPKNGRLRLLAQTMAADYAAAAAQQNSVGNGSTSIVPGFPTFNLNTDGNPQVTVKLQRSNLPLFFSRMWGQNLASVSATAVAEAYNPSFSQNNTSSLVPIAPKCVKPILLPNDAPKLGPNVQFVNVITGQVTPGKQFIGLQFDVRTACIGPTGGCRVNNRPSAGQYVPMLVGPTTHQYCPSSSGPGCTGSSRDPDYEKSIECCDGAVFNAKQCGGTATATWDRNVDPRGGPGGSPAADGLMCLIHSTGNGVTQQDVLDPSAFSSGKGPLLINPGAFSQARYGIASGDFTTTSDSIITVPIFDNSAGTLPTQLNIVGFLTLFVNSANPQNGTFSATVMNVSGCGNSASGSAPISGGGVSAIPVRLIHN